MQTLTLVQGTAEWAAHRAQHFNASDAPAMMACSPYKTRAELLHSMHTGISPEVDARTQRRFDDGHRFEKLALPVAEDLIGEDLSPVVGVSGKYSASFDGLTMDGSIAFEHKSLNDQLRAALMSDAEVDALPLHYRVQMEQQLMVSGASKVLFMASKWSNDEMVEEMHCWYTPDAELRAQIIAGWEQFAADLAAYVPPERAAAPVIVEAVEALPAPVVQVSGTLTLQDNFKVFEERLRDFLTTKLIREPKTDEDFVNLDAQIKAMKQGREALKAAKAQMLAQVQPVDQANKTAEMLDKLLQENCSLAERLLKDEKERRRGEIVAGGVSALRAHIDSLNERLGKPYMPVVQADFGGVIKGLKSLASMEDKVDSELARAKIEASGIADRIQINLATLREQATEVAFLFPDTAQIVQKAPDDLSALVKARIGEHQAKEAARIEADRERIRKEEAERAARIQRETQEAEDKLIASIWDNARRIEFDSTPYIRKAIAAFESGPGTFAGDSRPRVASAVVEARAEMKSKLDAATEREQAAAAAPAPVVAPVPSPAAAAPVPTPAHAPAPTVIAMPQRAPAAPASHPTLSLGQIKERIAPLSISAEGLAALGFVGLKERGSVLFHEAHFPHILAALVGHIQAIQAKQAA